MVISDTHVGDPRVDKDKLNLMCTMIKLESPDVLIFAGDILEGNLATGEQVTRLTRACTTAKQVVVLKGNHDSEPTKIFAQHIAASFGDCVTGDNNNKKFVVEHGNRFDSSWKRVPGLGHVAIWLNRFLYKITKFDFQEWFRTFEFVKKRLVAQHKKARAQWRDEDIVVTGHTHIPTSTPAGEGYFNTGDWIYHQTYIIINDGRARLESI